MAIGRLGQLGRLADANLSPVEQDSLYELLEAGLHLMVLAKLAKRKTQYLGDSLVSTDRVTGWEWADDITLFEAALERIHTRTRYIVRVPGPKP